MRLPITKILATAILLACAGGTAGCADAVDSAEEVAVATETTEAEDEDEAEEPAIAEYVSTLSQIPTKTLRAMDSRARELIEREYEDDKETLVDITSLSLYLLTARVGVVAENENMLDLVYFVTIRKYDEDGKDTYDELTYYWCGQYQNVGLDSEGNVVNDIDAMVSLNRHFSTPYKVHNEEIGVDIVRTHSGYEEFSTLYERIVIQNTTWYACETGQLPF